MTSDAAPRTPHSTPDEPPGAAAPARSASVASKLSSPLPTGNEIEREQVCRRVLAARAARLVLLRAPAGFGKTTAMVELRRRLAEEGVATTWLTLDRADNDVGRFLGMLSEALSSLLAARGGWAAPAAGSPDEIALLLLDRVAARPAPFALFLDDFESLQNPSVLGLVRQLIEHLPAGGKLVIGSRGVPELELGRLRGSGRLLEIEPTHLRFSVDEADRYLRQRRGLDLEPEDVLKLHRSTEGWAAALWLASVSLESRDEPGRFIAGFTGSNAAVVDYLVEDVLARQDEQVRGFLLRTSILSDLTPALCDVLCGHTDSARRLRELERAHLFLVPIQGPAQGPNQGEQTSWRYHSMFAEFLRTQLQRQHPHELPWLHRAAAGWFLAQGRPVPAIEHSLAANDVDIALGLLERHAEPLLEQGRVRLLSRWLDGLAARGVLAARPMLQVVHAWAVCLARGPRPATPLLEALEHIADATPEVVAHRRAMRPLLLVLADRTDEAMPLTASLLAELPTPAAGFVQGFLEVVLANLAMIAGQYHEALRLADAARSRQPTRASSFNLALSEAAEGAVDLTQGRLRKALAHLKLAVGAGASDLARATNGNAMAGVLLAEALYEANQCEQAERLLNVYIPLIRAVGIPDQLILAHTVMARIAAQRGDPDRSQQLLAELEHIGHRDGLPRVLASARLERARMHVVEGRLAAARAELERAGDKALWMRIGGLSLRANEVETHDLVAARCLIHGNLAEQAVALLRTELDNAERAQRERRALTLRLVLAQAYGKSGQRNKAMRSLARAVRFAASEGYVRALLDEGPLLLGMLCELHEVPDALADGRQPVEPVLAFVSRLVGDAAHVPAASQTFAPFVAATAAGPLGELTPKEVHVLRLSSEGLSNNELAERLFVAETTVRTHLRSIYVKLGVRNRTEALAIARRGGLIP